MALGSDPYDKLDYGWRDFLDDLKIDLKRYWKPLLIGFWIGILIGSDFL